MSIDEPTEMDRQQIQLQHIKLLTGNLSKLSWTERLDLFEAIHDGDDIELSRIEALI